MSGAPGEDLGPQYATAVQATADDDLLREMDDASDEGGQQEAKVTPKGGRAANKTMRDLIAERPTAPAPAVGGGDLVSTAADVAADIAIGVAESPGAIVRGAQGAVSELADSLDSAGAWVAVNAADALGDSETARKIEARRAGGEEALGSFISDPGASRSVTGNLVQGISQFVTGYVTGGKLLKTAGMIGTAPSVGGVFLKSAFADAFAFDPAQERLSNLLQEAEVAGIPLANPVTEFLASKPGDSEAVGRLKNSIEGLGIGAGANVVGAFIGALKGMRALQTIKAPPPTPEAISARVKEGLAPLGRPDGPAITTRKVPTGEAMPDGLASAGKSADGKDVFINFARIEAPEDVKSVLQKAANQFAGDIKEAQRGVQSFEATKALADDMGMTVDELLSRRKGPNGARTPFTAEEALAARRLHVASGTKLMELAEKAASPNAGQIDLFNFRKMMATHYAIQSEVIGARTETARALSSWRIGAEGGAAQLRMIEQAMESAGPDSLRMANELVRMRASGASPAAISQYARKSAFGTVVQGVREVYVNGLLSNPLTHIVNASGNLGTALLNISERGLAGQISKITGSDGVAVGEAAAMLHGLVQGQADAWRLAYKTMVTGETTDLLGKIDAPRAAAIASSRNDAFGTSVNALGSIVRTPGLLMASADQYFKSINYRAELHALAIRQASSEGLEGKAFGARVGEIVNNPPEGLRIQSADAALYNTFNSKMGWFGQTLMRLRESGGAINPTWLVATFIRTPVNIARYSFERTPLAPLVGQWRADLAAGGARRDVALARMAMGTMVMGITQSMVDGGTVSGALPEDMNEAALWRREGRQAYSVKVGDSWYSYNRADPFGMIMGFAADMQQTLYKGEIAPDDVDEWQEIAGAGIAAISNTAMEKTFMRGYAQFVEMVSDPVRYAPRQIKSTLGGFVPFSAALGAATRLTDPTQREARTPLDAIMARFPGLSERIIPRRDLWGEAVSDPHQVFNALSPMRASTENMSPIDKELDRLRVYPEGIGWKTGIDGVSINFSENPKALDEYRRLAGNGWKHPAFELGLKDFLDQTVQGKGPLGEVYKLYSDGERGGKASFIREWIQKYRQGAARALLADPANAAFRVQYEEDAAAQRQAKQRVTLN